MYCYHCGKQINEEKLEAKRSSFEIATDAESSEDINVQYVCPRCGHLIHKNHTEEDNKSLARAAHAQVQRANNKFASGMGNVAIGVILLALSIIFLLLSMKASTGFQINFKCSEFYVAAVLGAISVILLGLGLVFVITGKFNKKQYENLLKDLNNNTFIQ